MLLTSKSTKSCSEARFSPKEAQVGAASLHDREYFEDLGEIWTPVVTSQ